jgi:uncharacterized protein (DUF427 family)
MDSVDVSGIVVGGIMLRATWHGAVLAESDRTIKLGGNHYFPAGSLHREFFSDSTTTSTCPWKGQARYYDVRVDGTVNRDAAWYYPTPSPAALQIAGHVAFWHGVRIGRAAGPGGEPAPPDRPGLASRIRGGLRRAGRRA